MNTLSEIGNIPVDVAFLKSIFPSYKSVNNKISELEKSDKIIRLKRGMYIVSPKESGKLRSMELIPESVYIMRSMTTKHSKEFKNPLGKFEYTQCSKEYFPIGIRQEVKDNTAFLIASPEKTLCDLIVTTSNLNLRYQKELLTYLEEDLRFNMDELYKMDVSIFEQMLSRYEIVTDKDLRNAIYEVMQQITLAGLYRGGFFDKAAFYDGTCLRIFHKMERFSEDMDFSLLASDESFKLENYFQAIVEEFKTVGRDIVITKKDKNNFGKIESAFLKDDTEVYDVAFQTEKSLKIKIEVDTAPPMKFQTEQKLLLHPFSFMTRCFILPDLYAGKMHALVFRTWKNRVKGPDWYDFEWYVRNGIKLDFTHLQERIREFNGIEMDKEKFIKLLKERLISTDIKMVKQDVEPFIKNTDSLEIWSNDYFLQLADMIKLK
jgi:predicted nucleotidyltransferase component of viral defense system